MNKIVSIMLSIAVAMLACNTKTYAIGYHKVVDNNLGGKTTYVSSECLEEYMKKLKAEMDEVRKKYEDRYEIHPWKGFLMELSPILLAMVFNISLGLAMKIFNIKFKSFPKTNQMNTISSSPSSSSTSSAMTPVHIENKASIKERWNNTPLSTLQTVVLGVVSGFTSFLGLIKSKDYTRLSQSFEATEIWEKNKWILDDLTYAINDPDQTVRLYGAEIICEPCDFLDKINKRCYINSQKRFFTPGSTRYDPKLAETIPKLHK